MAPFLSQAWVDALATALADLPARAGASARVQHVVSGGPEGEVRYHLEVVDGRVEAAGLGDIEAPDLTCTSTYADAVRLAMGEVAAHEAFMQGRLKVVGSTGRLMDLLPVLDSDDHRRATADLRAATQF